MRVPKVRSIFRGLCAKRPKLTLAPPPRASLTNLTIHVLFSTRCWGSSGGRVGDRFSTCFGNGLTLRLSIAHCRLRFFHWPRQLSTAYTVRFPSGFAIRILRSWLGNSASPFPPRLRLNLFDRPPTTS